MYKRDVGTGTVIWKPKYEDIAATTIANHPDCPVDQPEDVQADAPIELSETAIEEVRQQYTDTVENTPGKEL